MNSDQIDTYLNQVDPKHKAELERIRLLLRSIIPDYQETISYGLPAFKYKNKYVVGFSSNKNHMGFYPTPGPIAELEKELSDFKYAKGSIQFTTDNMLSDELIKKIVAARLSSIDD